MWRALLDSLPPGIQTVALSEEPEHQLLEWSAASSLKVQMLVADAPYSTWGVHATPTTLLVNRDGKVVVARVGQLDGKGISVFAEAARKEVHYSPGRSPR
jgi:hypothetical protein